MTDESLLPISRSIKPCPTCGLNGEKWGPDRGSCPECGVYPSELSDRLHRTLESQRVCRYESDGM